MSEEPARQNNVRKGNSKQNMKTHIISMLKGVIIDEDQASKEYEMDDELKDTIFLHDDDSDGEKEDLDSEEEETNTNTADMTCTTFHPNQNEKAQTMKAQNPFFINNNRIVELGPEPTFQHKKFPTQAFNQNYFHNLNSSFGNMFPAKNAPIEPKQKNLPNVFFINQMNNINLNTVSPPSTPPRQKPQGPNQIMNIRNNYSNLPNCQNQNNGQPLPFMGVNMPLRTFKFKKIQSNQPNNSVFPNQSQSSFYYQSLSNQNMPQINYTNNVYPTQQMTFNKPGLANEDPVTAELESMLIQCNKFTFEIYMKLKGTFVSLIKSQQASRLCQFYIEQSPNEVVHLIFTELADQLPQLLLDPYANYFCLKLFYYLNYNDRMIYLKKICPFTSNLSINKIATYPIQCIIEHLNTDKEKELIYNSIVPYLMKLSLDIYGTHVIEKIISYFDYELIKPISNFILDNFLFLANNANGLCIVKKEIALEYKNENFERLKKELYNNALILIQNPYGNYALQMSIDIWSLEDIKEIITTFYGKCSVLSIQKYSSNVIERCLEKSEEFLNHFVTEICSNEGTIGLLMKNNYGNYVIQTALKVSKSNHQQMIINSIEKNLIQLNDKKLINKWKSIILAHSVYLTECGKEH